MKDIRSSMQEKRTKVMELSKAFERMPKTNNIRAAFSSHSNHFPKEKIKKRYCVHHVSRQNKDKSIPARVARDSVPPLLERIFLDTYLIPSHIQHEQQPISTPEIRRYYQHKQSLSKGARESLALHWPRRPASIAFAPF